MSAVFAAVFSLIFSGTILAPLLWVFGSYYGLRWYNAHLRRTDFNDAWVRRVKLLSAFCGWTGLLLWVF